MNNMFKVRIKKGELEMKKDKYFREYECEECGYRGEETDIKLFYGEDDDDIIDETTMCPSCGEYEKFYCKKY